MKLYLATISDTSYDEYDAVLVRAKDEADAMALVTEVRDREVYGEGDDLHEEVTMKYSGVREDGSNVAIMQVTSKGERGEVIASYNAG